MKMLIRKELRENAWLLLGGCLLMVLGYLRSQYALLPNQAWLSTTRRSFLMVTTLGGAGFMLVLGFRQMFGEVRRGSWAFLVHRPITMRQIFLAKAIAAMLLFGAAIVVPTAGAVAWCAWPGHIAGPFTPAMVTPAAVDLLSAVPYYFAGCAIGMWQARWTVSRALLLILPLANSVFAHDIARAAWMPVLAGVLVSIWMSLLARDIFVGLERAPRVGWARLCVSLALGLVCLHGVATVLLPQPYPDGPNGPPIPATEEWFLARDGVFRRALVTRHHVKALFEKDGTPVEGEFEGAEIWFGDLEADSSYLPAKPRKQRQQDSYRAVTRYVRLAQLDESYTREWYFDRQGNRFVAYGRQSRAVVGHLGPDGFAAGNGNTAFVGEPLDQRELTDPLQYFEGGVYRVNWRRATVERVGLASDAALQRRALLISSGIKYSLVRTASHVEVLKLGRPLLSIPLDPDLDGSRITVGHVVPTNEFFVRYPIERSATYVFHGADGQESRRWTPPPLPVSELPKPTHFTHSLRPALVAPPVLVGIRMMIDRYWHTGHGVTPWGAKHAATAALVGLLSALLAFVLGRGHTRGLRLGIAALCLIGGPSVALLTWLLPRQQGVACPRCTKLRPIDATACAACATPLLAYAESDTSIVDAAFQPS